MKHPDRYYPNPTRQLDLPVRLLVITPVAPEDGQEGPFPVNARERQYLLPETQVDEVLCNAGPSCIVSADQFQQVVPLIVQKAQWGEANGYDAIVINCMIDPGLEETRRALRIPVVGAGRAAYSLANVLGNRPARIYPSGIPVNSLTHDEHDTIERLRFAAEHQISERGADVVVFTCSYLGGAASRLQNEVGIPVMTTIDIALRTAELIVLLGVLPKPTEDIEKHLKARKRRSDRRSNFRKRVRHYLQQSLKKTFRQKKASEPLAK
ncbi:MAG: aspartate/glutamate racemase family protein [Hyphomicrobiaceae bacterium]